MTSIPAALTSTTAPGSTFNSRLELANHYKSDWHKYNLKRREMNMTMLTHEEFNARLEAALALKREREMKDERSGKDHLKDKKSLKQLKKEKKKQSKGKDKGRHVSKRQLRQKEKKREPVDLDEEESVDDKDENKDEDVVMNNNENNENTQTEEEQQEQQQQQQQPVEEEAPPEINPNQCLFDNHISDTIDENIEYMYKKYGFFIPDIEYLVDKTGLIGYCHEKIKLGHTCLYSQKVFTTWQGCQRHMISCSHTKLRYERGIDLEEFDVFYDFTEDDADFLNSGIGNYKKKNLKNKKKGKKSFTVTDAVGANDHDDIEDDDDDDDSGEWEDIDSDEEMEDNDKEEEEDDDDGLYAAYRDEIAQHGLDITPLGELIFPDGRIVGHRGLSRYYKQRISLGDSRASVMAVRRANGERLLNGRVYDTYDGGNENSTTDNANSMELVKAGLAIGAVRGRQGNGILVPTNKSAIGGRAGTSYTALSLYRYKAAVKKSRKEEFKALKMVQRTTLPMNKMDKKANRLFNNVSVAHAKR